MRTMDLNGYTGITQILSTDRVGTFTATRLSDNAKVVLKEHYMPLDEAAEARVNHELSRFRKENLTSLLSPQAVERSSSGLVFVSEFDSGVCADKWVHTGQPSLEEFLNFATNAAASLAEIHGARLLHRNLKPSNTIIEEKTGLVRFVDPGISVVQQNATQDLRSEYTLKRVLPYLAPEQTGRVAWELDHRADFYSLGICFFEILTGRLPYEAKDALSLIHAHLAIEAPCPGHYRPNIPEIMCKIIMKLMAKDPENRYHSASGIKADLERVAKEWQTTGSASSFILGEKDVVDDLHFSTRLFGRDSQLKQLESVLDDVCQGSCALVSVTGPAGVGKSALVNDFAKVVQARNCFFLDGRAEQFKRDIPYLPFMQIFSRFAAQLLLEHDELLVRWKRRFSDSMGTLGQVIIDLCPEIARVVGEQPILPELPPHESQLRVALAVSRFISLTVELHNRKPLVLFFDDLQWSDHASLDLLKTVVLECRQLPLLVLGAIRELNDGSPTLHAMDFFRSQNIPVHTCVVSEFCVNDVKAFLAEALLCAEADVEPLAVLVQEKTLGNPLFVRVFLRAIYSIKLLRYRDSYKWEWALDAIRNQRGTANVIELLCHRVSTMPQGTQEVLRSLVFAGGKATLLMLARISESNVRAVLNALEPALRAGLTCDRDGEISFVHDRIHEAVRVLIDENTYAKKRLTVGRLLQKYLTAEEQESRLFEIVMHLNAGIEQMRGAERAKLARLNLAAVQKAKRTAAFALALDLCRHGIDCLEDDASQEDYELFFALYCDLAELEFLNSDFRSAERTVTELTSRLVNPVDKAQAYSLLIQQYNMEARYALAISTAQTALNLVNIDFPLGDPKERLKEELARCDSLLSGKDPQEFLNALEMKDPTTIIAVKILALVGPAIFVSRPDLFSIAAVLTVRLSLEYGHSAYSAYAYAAYGFILATDRHDFKKAYAFAELGMRLADAFGDPIQQCRTTHMAAFIQHFVKPIRETNELFKKGFKAGVECGENEWACFHAHFRAARLMIEGNSLAGAAEELQRLREFTVKAKNTHAVHLIDAVLLPVSLLTSDNLTEESLFERLAAAADINQWAEKGSHFAIFIYRVLHAYLALMFQHYEQALEEAEAALKLAHYAPNHPYVETAHFVRAMACLKVLRLRPEWTVGLAEAERELAYLRPIAQSCPDNYLAKVSFIEAEMAYAKGDYWSAIGLYEDARNQARRSGFTHEVALICDCMHQFWLAQGRQEQAQTCLREAVVSYDRWGARVQVKALCKELGMSIESLLKGEEIRWDMDFRSLIKASQAIAQEIDFPSVVTRLMEVMLENAGAQSGALFSCRDSQLALVATVNVNEERVHLFEELPFDESESFCATIVRYVSRLGARLIIRDATTDERFSNNEYVLRYKPRSVLCSPIWHGDSLKGLIYLENRLSAGAFSSERAAVLDVLIGQAGISLENAELFARQREAEQRYKEVFNATTEAIFVHDAETFELIDVNDSMLAMYRCTREDALSGSVADYSLNEPPYTKREALEWLRKALTEGPQVFDWLARKKTGEQFWVEVTLRATNIGGAKRILAVVRDTDERRRLEEQLRQAQKMEAIGQLAGGLAHDFNNLLQGTLGYIDLAVSRVHSENEVRQCLKKATDAAQRAATLTRQLLAFSRQQIMQALDLDLHKLIEQTLVMIRRVIGEHIDLSLSSESDCAIVHADPTQIEQILINLCINARDAMPAGGALRISTEKIELDDEFCRKNTWARSGKFAVIAVEDKGHGMDALTKERVFEPFFTTKEVGRGTGLGMAMVYGIVRQHKGLINIESEVGQGTTVKVYLPLVARLVADVEISPAEPRVRGTETVLIVEDEALVRDLTQQLLVEAGYKVLTACNGEEALALLANEASKIDLVLLDIIMPKVGGRQVYEEIKSKGYSTKVLFTSGYSEDAVNTNFFEESGLQILKKPYRTDTLLKILREILGTNCEN